MPRQPRYFLPDIPQHVIQRGVNRQPIFFQPQDYERYREVLRVSAIQYGCRIHAYVLMTNHTHLLVTPQHPDSLPLLMQAMGRSYVQALNRRYDRTGTLWQGRYKASPVESERYLLVCSRYIELNPVRAGLVASPEAYPYSSYCYNALGQPDPLISQHDVYESLADSLVERRATYRRFFGEDFEPELLNRIRDTTNACLVLGTDEFQDQLEKLLGHSVRPRKGGRPRVAPS